MDIKCTYSLVGAGILTGATHYTLKHCQENPALVAAFNSCALPAGVKLIELSKGCVCFTVQAESLSALKELWERYESGSLRNSLKNLLVTDQIKNMAKEREVELKVNMDQDSYQNVCFDLLIEENEGGFICKPHNIIVAKKLFLTDSKTSFVCRPFLTSLMYFYFYFNYLDCFISVVFVRLHKN